MTDTTINPEDYFNLYGFGEPVSAIKKNFLAYTGLMRTMDFFVPPIRKADLVSSLDANPHHACAINYETRTSCDYFQPNNLLKFFEFKKAVKDYFTGGELYLLKIRNIFGEVVRLQHLPFMYMRVKENGDFAMLNHSEFVIRTYPKEDIVHLKGYDQRQNVYGMPEWYPQLQAVLLGEDALLLPRREFLDGTTRKLIALMGFTNDQAKSFNTALKESKGSREKTLVTGLPDKDGKKIDDIMKIFPDDSAFKVDFAAFYELSAVIIMECHRIPPFLVGQNVEKGASSPDLKKVEAIYAKEILSNQLIFEQINEDVSSAVVFDKQPLLNLINQTN